METHSHSISAICSLLIAGTVSVAPRAAAGEREWAVAGKVLTGVVVAHVLSEAIAPTLRYETRVVRRVVVVPAPPRASHRCEVRIVHPQRHGRPHRSHSSHSRAHHGRWDHRPAHRTVSRHATPTIVYQTSAPTCGRQPVVMRERPTHSHQRASATRHRRTW